MTGRRLVVVGGGISGLAAAHAAASALERAGRRGDIEVLLLERARDVGGKASSRREGAWLVEEGPTGFLDNEPILDRLATLAGLQKLPARAAAARRYVVRGGRPRELKPHPLAFAMSGVLSPLGLLRLIRERWVKPLEGDVDESVHDFAVRRLGRQAATRLVGPMVSGVHAGDPRHLSLAAAFPRMREMERQHGSLFKALAAKRKAAKAAGTVSGGPMGPSGVLTSFADGLQSLPRALARAGGIEVRTHAEVAALVPGSEGLWRVGLADGTSLDAHAVVLATEGWAAAPLMESFAPDASRALAEIRHPPLHVVALGFGAEALARCPVGFGALVPRDEGYRMLGVLEDTHVFPGRSAPGTLLLRVMLGGATDPRITTLSVQEVEDIAVSEVMRLFGLRTPPVFRHTKPWVHAIPQYAIGHRDRAATAHADLERASRRVAPLHLAGNVFGGVAFSASAATGWRAGERAAQELLAAPA
ncbi:MAG: protoporphyrinogen oxidase [Planctomycetota bacterium]